MTAKVSGENRVALSDALRQAIQDGGVSYNELRRMAGVDNSLVSRFMRGERDMTLQIASRICLYLGYELVRTAGVLKEPLEDPPPSNRRRPENARPPETAHARGRGRRVDLEGTHEQEGIEPKKPPRRKARSDGKGSDPKPRPGGRKKKE